MKERLKKGTGVDKIQELLIRSEKHGALYHPASVEILIDAQRLKLTVSTAVSEKGKEWLAHEYEILNGLNSSFNLPYLPKTYMKGEVTFGAGDKDYETLTMLLAEWFEGYHEWHFAIDETDNTQKICIWDIQHGNRYASEEEAFEIFKQASKILTLYYNTTTFNQIYPWHHAAGDFIVGTRDGKIDVRLTTARKYESIMPVFSEGTGNPLIAIIYFFLNLTVRMRLDKLDGVGKTIWAGNFSVNAATTGYFEALKIMAVGGRYDLGHIEELLSLLKSFNEEELEGLFQPLFGLYQQDDPEDLSVIQANLEKHAQHLYSVIQEFRL